MSIDYWHNRTNDEYLDDYEVFAKGLDLPAPGIAVECCDICRESWGDVPEEERIDEGSFSTSNCDLCGTPLAGYRFAAHAWRIGENPRTDPVTHLSICVDCRLFTVNGDLPNH